METNIQKLEPIYLADELELLKTLSSERDLQNIKREAIFKKLWPLLREDKGPLEWTFLSHFVLSTQTDELVIVFDQNSFSQYGLKGSYKNLGFVVAQGALTPFYNPHDLSTKIENIGLLQSALTLLGDMDELRLRKRR